MIEAIILCTLAIILAVSVFCSIQAERRRERYLRDIMMAVDRIEQHTAPPLSAEALAAIDELFEEFDDADQV